MCRLIENKMEQNELDFPGGAGGAVGGAGRPPNITVGETLVCITAGVVCVCITAGVCVCVYNCWCCVCVCECVCVCVSVCVYNCWCVSLTESERGRKKGKDEARERE